jgi:hypothetical protein
MKYRSHGGMVWHMAFRVNSVAGVVGAIVGGVLSASWATKKLLIVNTRYMERQVPNNDTFQERLLRRMSEAETGIKHEPVATYDWFPVSETTYDGFPLVAVPVADALTGAFLVLRRVGILRKVHRI